MPSGLMEFRKRGNKPRESPRKSNSKSPAICGALTFEIILLLLTRILSPLFVVDTRLASIACGAAYTVHSATEPDGAVGLVFFQEPAGAGAEPVSAVIPASTLDNAGFIADQRSLAIAVSDARNGGVTIEVVDHVALLIVTTGPALG